MDYYPHSNFDDEDLTFNYDTLITDTDDAWLLNIDGENIWLPKSKCELNENDKIVYVPEWLAIAKDLV